MATQFKDLGIGDTFHANGLNCRKVSSRTADIGNGLVFYYGQKESVVLDEKAKPQPAKPLRLVVVLECERTGKQTSVLAYPPSIAGGIWAINERARRDAFKRMGADWNDSDARVYSSATLRAVDENGYHTFTIYPKG